MFNFFLKPLLKIRFAPKCLLSSFNQGCNMYQIFNRSPQHQISWKLVQWISNRQMYAAGHTDTKPTGTILYILVANVLKWYYWLCCCINTTSKRKFVLPSILTAMTNISHLRNWDRLLLHHLMYGSSIRVSHLVKLVDTTNALVSEYKCSTF